MRLAGQQAEARCSFLEPWSGAAALGRTGLGEMSGLTGMV